MPSQRRVVVTGLGLATPIGLGVEAFWDALVDRKCGLGRIEAFDPSGMPSPLGGELPPFKLPDYIPKTYRKSVKVMSRDIMIAVLCAYEAVKDAGLITKCIIERGEAEGSPNLDPDRFGVNIGAGLICADLPELAGALATAADDEGHFSHEIWGETGMTNLTPLWLLKFLPNMLACHVTIVHDAHAPSNTITCGEASSHLAIGEAFRTISRGDADVCICGGAESKMNPMALARQHLMGNLTANHADHPEQACTPFGADRSGTVASEGGGLVILEEIEHARSRKARIYAEVVGFSASTNSNHWAKPDQNGLGIKLALRRAMDDAQTNPGKMNLVAPLGLGTNAHDAASMAGWNEVFADRPKSIPAIATCGSIGNNGAGSGAIEFAAAVLALHRNTIPPSLCTDDLDQACRFAFGQSDAVDAEINEAISAGSALGGGQNAAIVIRKHRE